MKFDGVVLNKIIKQEDFELFTKELEMKGEAFVVKPCWSNAYTYTSAQVLEWLFQCLNGKKAVVESYTAWRNELNVGPESEEVVTPANAKRKWKWIRDQDKWFLDYSGIGKVLEKYDVEYVNVTEEVWSGRIADAEEVRKLVETKFPPIKRKEMYGFVPEKIYNLKGSVLISINNSRKTREIMSLSTKNLFGLIPDPARYGKWHGENDELLPTSIVDINKIYRSLFPVNFWINELKERKIFVGSRNSVLADAVAAQIEGVNPKGIEYLNVAALVFGGFDESILTNLEGLGF